MTIIDISRVYQRTALQENVNIAQVVMLEKVTKSSYKYTRFAQLSGLITQCAHNNHSSFNNIFVSEIF